MTLRVLAGAVLLSMACTLAAQEAQRPQPLKSGLDFTGPEVQELQKDDFANPGMLWVTRGETLWQQPAGRENKSCASCHGDAKTSMKGVATRYPQIDRATAKLVNLEGRIQQCQQRHQQAEPFKYETEGLLGLTAYIAMQSRGMPKNVTIDMQNRRHFEAGRDMYYRRQGQMNLSCAQCHQDNWGKKLGPEIISQGHGVAYPIYRLEWQTMGSLHRKFRSCESGVRAALTPQGSPEFLDLELYLAWRETGLPIETPGVRR